MPYIARKHVHPMSSRSGSVLHDDLMTLNARREDPFGGVYPERSRMGSFALREQAIAADPYWKQTCGGRKSSPTERVASTGTR